MKIHYLQHVPFENLANIEKWAHKKSFNINKSRLFANETLPTTDSFDWLIVMGGPMNIYEDKKYPWLTPEKKLIEKAIKEEKMVLGVCLGAQLIADVLGGVVSKNTNPEIGWFPVETVNNQGIFPLPSGFMAFHWHGDTFSIPPKAIHWAASKGCTNQAFLYANHVLGLQFHLESSPESVQALIENCGEEMIAGKYVQTPEYVMAQEQYFTEIKGSMTKLLDNFIQLTGNNE